AVAIDIASRAHGTPGVVAVSDAGDLEAIGAIEAGERNAREVCGRDARFENFERGNDGARGESADGFHARSFRLGNDADYERLVRIGRECGDSSASVSGAALDVERRFSTGPLRAPARRR